MRGRPFAARHGLAITPAYNSWKKMMSRCYRETNKDFPGYGGRGIRVCDRWHDPSSFVEDMGHRQKWWSLERIDVNGDYCQANCKWIPLAEQSKNRREWTHTEEGIKGLSVWSGKQLSKEHRNRISTSVRAKRAEMKE